MSDSPETVVRRFFDAFLLSNVDELVGFFSDDAVYIDGPRGVHRGIEAIRSEFATLAAIVPSTSVDIKTLTTDRSAVMVERGERFEIEGKPIDHEVVGVFDLNDHGQITRWRDYYDLPTLLERVAAATQAIDPST
jgi:limonene-1,2-epoxide hydrolase